MKRRSCAPFLDLDVTTEEHSLSDTALARLVREARGERFFNDRHDWWTSGADHDRGDYIG